jgi:hypothetical protein
MATAVIAPGTRRDTLDTVSAGLPVVWHDAPTTVADVVMVSALDGPMVDHQTTQNRATASEPNPDSLTPRQADLLACWKITQD